MDMENEQIKTDPEVIEPTIISDDDFSEELQTNEDGSLEEVYRDKRTGNIVTPPSIRAKNKDNTRREKCWELYVKSVRDGNPSARAAAIAAGFSENSAINIRGMRWFKDRNDKLRRSKMMTNAEKNIARILNLGLTKIRKLEDGSEEEVFDPDRARIVADMSKMIVTTLGKDDGYSSKTEVKVSALPTPILELEDMNILPKLEESNEVVE